ncbi:MAG: hypothetical protein R3A48_24845 [Polyangiales bacterium]
MIISLAITLVVLAITGVTFAKVFLPMIQNANSLMTGMANAANARAELLARGTDGMGRILGVRETGTLVNYQPELQFDLEVQSAQGQRFNAQCTAVVSPMNLARVQPGATVPVRFDPTNLARVALAI